MKPRKDKYNHRANIRLSANQLMEIEQLCNQYNTTVSAVVRLAIDKLIDSIYKDIKQVNYK